MLAGALQGLSSVLDVLFADEAFFQSAIDFEFQFFDVLLVDFPHFLGGHVLGILSQC